VLQGPRSTPPPQFEPSVAKEVERRLAPSPLGEGRGEGPKEVEKPAASEPPFVFPPLLDRIVPPELKLDKLPPLQVPPPTEVQVPAPPAEAPPPEPIAPAPPPAPLETLAPPLPTPRVERLPAEAPPIAAPLLQPVLPPLPERPATPPIERAPVDVQAIPTVTSTPPADRPPVEVPAIPKPVETAPAQEIQAAPKVPPAAERVEPRLPEREAPVKIDREGPPSPRPSPKGEGEHRSSSPKAEGAYDPTAPTLDVDALRSRAGQIAREGSGRRAILPFPMPPVPERKSKMETAIENARKPDCRTAYQNLGLAAVVPLIANEFGEGTCRW
jgi:hypothetical protein